jgi:hypothetical protein
VSGVSRTPEVGTSQEELLGTTTGIILTVVVAVVGLAVLILPMFLAAGQSNIRRPWARQRLRKLNPGAPSDDAGGVPPRRDDNQASDMVGPAGGATGGQEHWPSERLEDRHVPGGGNPHGKPSSWVLVAVVTAAFITGGLAIITHTWWLVWACGGIVVLAVPIGKAIGIMDDTVAWGSTPAATHDPPPGP